MSADIHSAHAARPEASAGLLAAAVSASLYGISAPFARMAAEANLIGADLILWRVGVMVCVLGLATWVLGRRPLAPRAAWPGVLLFAATVLMVGTCYLSAVAFIPVGIAVVIFYTFPLIILLVSPFIDRRRPTPAQFVAFALAFAGLVLAIGPQWTTLDPRGLALAAMASVACAVQVFTGSRVGRRLDPLTFAFSAQLVVVPGVFLVALAFGGPAGPEALGAALKPLSVIVLTYIAAFVLQLRAMRLAAPSAVGLVFTLEPVIAIATAAALLGEKLVTSQYMGVALVLAGLVVAVAPGASKGRKDSAA
ncbi:DMT family transporter [Bosea sp. 117]|uniref:EamA family transporter n=1 Tax=Bosea sp. 117 TaxID=1125973 RepID=UPI000494566D|nr:DMT family transporter [Bosea sp. 117]